VQGRTCDAPGAALRTNLRAFHGVHQQSLHLDVATYDARLKTKRRTPTLKQRMCVRDFSAYAGYT